MPIYIPPRDVTFEIVDYLELSADMPVNTRIADFGTVDTPYYWLVDRIVAGSFSFTGLTGHYVVVGAGASPAFDSAGIRDITTVAFPSLSYNPPIVVPTGRTLFLFANATSGSYELANAQVQLVRRSEG